MHTYKVWLSNHSSYKVKAGNIKEAKLKVWNEIKDGYTYGWDKNDFLENATVERIME